LCLANKALAADQQVMACRDIRDTDSTYPSHDSESTAQAHYMQFSVYWSFFLFKTTLKQALLSMQ
jgi:hypothetical protein